MCVDKVTLVGQQGPHSFDISTFREMMERAPYKIKSYRFLGPAQARIIGPNIGFIAYQVHEHIFIEGKPIQVGVHTSLSVFDRRSLWQKCKCCLKKENPWMDQGFEKFIC